MNRKKTIGVSLGAFLILASGIAYALPPRVSWIPPELKPESVAPGSSASYTVVLKHTGILPIPLARQLRVVAEGDIVPFVSITQPTFPLVFRRGNMVNVGVTVSVPASILLSVKTGELVLKRFLSNGTITEVWRANTLPVELTISTIPLPPDPGEEGKETVEGIITNDLAIRDDVLRAIVFNHPNSEKERMSMIQYAQAEQKFLADYVRLKDGDQTMVKQVTRENARARGRAMDCQRYVLGSGEALDTSRKELKRALLNTPARLEADNEADFYLGGMVGEGTLSREQKAQCSTDPDTLPN
ncbi:hypothetical protein L0244_21005 [bacterium]|nr:hypothetical protein [bacterium]